MEPQHGDANDTRKRFRLRREIALTLAIKLVLIVLIKIVFFSDPVAQTDVEKRLSTVFSSEPGVAVPTPTDSTRRNNDQ